MAAIKTQQPQQQNVCQLIANHWKEKICTAPEQNMLKREFYSIYKQTGRISIFPAGVPLLFTCRWIKHKKRVFSSRWTKKNTLSLTHSTISTISLELYCIAGVSEFMCECGMNVLIEYLALMWLWTLNIWTNIAEPCFIAMYGAGYRFITNFFRFVDLFYVLFVCQSESILSDWVLRDEHKKCSKPIPIWFSTQSNDIPIFVSDEFFLAAVRWWNGLFFAYNGGVSYTLEMP